MFSVFHKVIWKSLTHVEHITIIVSDKTSKRAFQTFKAIRKEIERKEK